MSLVNTNNATDTCQAMATLILVDAATNMWALSGTGICGLSSGSVSPSYSSSYVSLPSALTQLTFFDNGGRAFDAGSLSYTWRK
jgi:hypothetical protein